VKTFYTDEALIYLKKQQLITVCSAGMGKDQKKSVLSNLQPHSSYNEKKKIKNIKVLEKKKHP
jgi:hypothetical protein